MCNLNYKGMISRRLDKSGLIFDNFSSAVVSETQDCASAVPSILFQPISVSLY